MIIIGAAAFFLTATITISSTHITGQAAWQLEHASVEQGLRINNCSTHESRTFLSKA
jgi:hypothetical protein